MEVDSWVVQAGLERLLPGLRYMLEIVFVFFKVSLSYTCSYNRKFLSSFYDCHFESQIVHSLIPMSSINVYMSIAYQ